LEKDTRERIIRESVALAETWQNRGNELLTTPEKRFQNRMRRLLTHPFDKVIMTQLIDQSFRAKQTRRVADQMGYVFEKWGIPHFFSPLEQLLSHVFVYLGKLFSMISIPIFIEQLRRESRRVILPGDAGKLFLHLKKRTEEGVRMNINHLGEAVLGEAEARFRLDQYISDLKSPDIDYISVKISTICSQINTLAFDHTVDIVKTRLTELFSVARKNPCKLPDGRMQSKFVNLDMEEYRDLEITAKAFMDTLDQEMFLDFSAGIVLQAYVPDSYNMQQTITAWARKRIENGHAPIKIRIVKGANMEMEKIESSLFNWPLAPYDNKLSVDANYKKMVAFGMRPENIRAAHLGIASHNLFELAFAYNLAKDRHVAEFVSFEMLEGMADHIRRAIQETSNTMLLYAPVASKDQFISAIAYLIRRLDENTAKDNFLRYAPGMTTTSEEWRFLRTQFENACKAMETVSTASHRIRSRENEKDDDTDTGSTFVSNAFVNEPDTDWALKSSRKWAESIRERWQMDSNANIVSIPLVVAGKEIHKGRETRIYKDPSRYTEDIRVASFTLADETDIRKAAETARKDPDQWRSTRLVERHEKLSRVASNIRKMRGDLIGSAAAGTGKTFRESDPEVSEAIDFCEFYPWSLKFFEGYTHLHLKGKGVGLVISPWNFPIAIPCGGIVAALAAGNTVILKPATAAVLPAWILCNCFWEAGISKNTLQFLPLSGEHLGNQLTGHPDVDFIIFTGGTETALSILKMRPDIHFAGETGGKNTTIVTAMADRDQAIKNVIHSAFSNCGQKCSATSLLILEKEVYEDPHFKKQLVDAAKSYQTGSVWAFENLMGPLIQPPSGDLKRAISTLEPDEEWALPPKNVAGNPYLYTPSIKWNVSPGSYTHITEFFGPVLSVMKADSLSHAISLANQTGYGLTAGLESLDEREHAFWKQRIRAGNLYINRGTTGAIVLRQPFGGMGKSAIGAGIKAGGMNYALQFTSKKELAPPVTGAVQTNDPQVVLLSHIRRHLETNTLLKFKEDFEKMSYAVKSYVFYWETEFSKEKDYFHLRGQDNFIRYVSLGRILIRVHEEDSLFDILARIVAAKITGGGAVISLPTEISTPAVDFLFSEEGRKFRGTIDISRQSDDDLVKIIHQFQSVRYAGNERVSHKILETAAQQGLYISRDKVFMDGRIELLQYLREQSICVNYHRYGNLGERITEFE